MIFSKLAAGVFALSCHQTLAVLIPSNQHVLIDDQAKTNSVLHVREELRKAEIIPTVLDDFVPSATITISWPFKDTDNYNISTKLGNTISPSDVQRSPNAILDDERTSQSEKKKSKYPTFVLTLTDPDAPSRDDPKWSEMCHWIVAVEGLKHAKPHEVVAYKPPGPPPKTGKHRYVFTVWIPANRTTHDLNLKAPNDRQHWGYDPDTDGDAGRVGVRKWASDMGLMPIAANFIYSKNDEQ